VTGTTARNRAVDPAMTYNNPYEIARDGPANDSEPTDLRISRSGRQRLPESLMAAPQAVRPAALP
jgi:hypothetical protein